MAQVYAGKDGKITINAATSNYGTTNWTGGSTHEIAGMGSWTVSGITRDMLDKTSFGDQWKGVKQGVADGGTVTFSGFFDWTDTTGQVALINHMNNSRYLTKAHDLRLWVSDSTGDTKRGFFSLSTAAGSTNAKMYFQSLNAKQDKSSLGTIDVTLKVSEGFLTYSTAT